MGMSAMYSSALTSQEVFSMVGISREAGGEELPQPTLVTDTVK